MHRESRQKSEFPRTHWVRGNCLILNWLRGQDLNLGPSGYEPDELPGCSTPRWVMLCFMILYGGSAATDSPAS